MGRAATPPAGWWVYLLRCADGTLYTGVTTDPARRLRQHAAGTASKYTRSRRPVEMVYREGRHTRGSALRRELEIKALKRAEKLALVARRKKRHAPAKTRTPPTTSPPPSATRQVKGSPRKTTARTMTRATLSLSTGATRDAGAS